MSKVLHMDINFKILLDISDELAISSEGGTMLLASLKMLLADVCH